MVFNVMRCSKTIKDSMKIVYSGSYLKEGLIRLGAELFPLDINAGKDFTTCVYEACPAPDFVLLEFFGKTFLGKNIVDCPVPCIAYCFDTPINLYLLEHVLKLFDYVFVDQKKAVSDLAQHNIHAVWLPFCVTDNWFRAINANPTYELTFVGRFSSFRIKRSNLLKYVKEHHEVNEWADVSFSEMQDIYANSRIILNENLFNGLNLRLLQGMATGSLVLTESDMDGVADFFKDGEHIVCYNSSNIIDIIQDILDNPQKYSKIAAEGQKICREKHTSTVRAQELFSQLLGDKTFASFQHGRVADANDGMRSVKKYHAHINNISYDELRLEEIIYNYKYIRRFGGVFQKNPDLMHLLTNGSGVVAARASCLMGDILSRRNKADKAQFYYEQALEQVIRIKDDPVYLAEIKRKSQIIKLHAEIYCRMGIFFLMQSNLERATCMVDSAAQVLLQETSFVLKDLSESNVDIDIITENIYRLVPLFHLAQLYDIMGKIFDLGFLRHEADICPDTALDIALMAWKESYNTIILEFILEKSQKYNVAGELLPQLSYAVGAGFVTKKQILKIIEIANSYYDKELAHRLFAIYERMV